jgi:hypothetical protein
MHHGDISPQIAQGLLALQKRITAAKIPPSKLDETINVAVWNIREFGKVRRTEAAIHYIAEVLGQFDLVALVELRNDLTDLGRVLPILGPSWDVVYSDWIDDAGGNKERVAFLFDSRAVTFNGLAAEVDAPRGKNGTETGGRSEQFSLRWEHVNLERGILTLPDTKSGGVQYVRLNEEAKRLIQGFIPGNKSVWVFPSENPATHADPRNFYRRVYLPKIKEIGLDGISWHSLRHTFASRLAMSGSTEGTIASLLRHSGTVLVRRYAHLSPSHLQGELEKVSAFGKVADQQPGRTVAAGEGVTADESQPCISIPTVTETVTGVVA